MISLFSLSGTSRQTQQHVTGALLIVLTSISPTGWGAAMGEGMASAIQASAMTPRAGMVEKSILDDLKSRSVKVAASLFGL